MKFIQNLMSVQDFAEQMNESIGMGINKVYALVKEPGFPSVRIGGRFFVLVDKVNDWLDKKAAIRFHDLRHSFATISLQNGDDIKTVSENLGHATVAFTLDVYGHVTEKMRKDSADRMQKYIDSVGG